MNIDKKKMRRALTGALATLLMGAASAQGALVGVLESPIEEEPTTGINPLQGWIYDNDPAYAVEGLVEVHIDGMYSFSAPCCGDREDVQNTFPDAPLLTGFSATFNWGNLSKGKHDLVVIARSTSGEQKVFSREITVVKASNNAFLKSFEFNSNNQFHCVSSNQDGTASLVCTGTEMMSGGGAMTGCNGTLRFEWDKRVQGFLLRSNCTILPPDLDELLDTPPFPDPIPWPDFPFFPFEFDPIDPDPGPGPFPNPFPEIEVPLPFPPGP